MTLYSNLQIDAPKEVYQDINKILGVDSNSPHKGWELGLEEKEED